MITLASSYDSIDADTFQFYNKTICTAIYLDCQIYFAIYDTKSYILYYNTTSINILAN